MTMSIFLLFHGSIDGEGMMVNQYQDICDRLPTTSLDSLDLKKFKQIERGKNT